MAEALEDRTLVAGAGRPRLDSGLHVEVSPRWVRAFFGGQPVAASRRALLVFEPRRLPVYYFPFADVRMDLLRETDFSSGAGGGSDLARWTLEADGRTVDNVGWSYRDPDADHARLKEHIAFYWNKLDAWFEEDDEVFVHPRDPYHRVDVLNSSRRSWPTRIARACCSRPACLRGTTSPRPTCAWTCSSRPRPARSAPTRARPSTGPFVSGTRS
jgi:uncharacterized protein (DUF427 family)